jgi:hypothetical protein
MVQEGASACRRVHGGAGGCECVQESACRCGGYISVSDCGEGTGGIHRGGGELRRVQEGARGISSVHERAVVCRTVRDGKGG